MHEHLLLGLAGILILGIAAQWIAWRVRLPSILLLLAFGLIAGPITGFLHPDEVLGNALFPFVSISVALILFEGGLSLKFRDLEDTGHVIRNLITIGTATTWGLSSLGAHYLLGFDWPLALLFGAVLIVTGPTVIVPLLRQIRAVGKVSSIVKWEGIVNDPIGAIIAVFVFETILITGVEETTVNLVTGILLTLVGGVVFGGLSVGLLVLLLKRHWIPDNLQNAVAIMMVIAAFTASNLLQSEAGLFTVTLMGVTLANQKWVSVKPIVEFKEQLGILLLSNLFIILAARLSLESLSQVGWHSVAFLAVLVLLIRPMTVLLSTIRSGLNWSEKFFLAWMAPRGIVAAAVTAIFALELTEQTNYTQAETMVPEMFFVILGTVAIYGLSAAPLGRWLGVAKPNPQGILFVGAHEWARAMAATIHEHDFEVMLVDTNRENVNAAKMAGLPAVYASVLSDYFEEEVEFGSIGRLLAVTPNDEVNSLAALHFSESFDSSGVFQLSPKEVDASYKKTISSPLRGRLLFDSKLTYEALEKYFESGTIKATRLTDQFDFNAYKQKHGNRAVPLFLIGKNDNLSIFTTDNGLNPQPGDTLISLVSTTELMADDTLAIKSPSSSAAGKSLSEVVS